MAKGDWHPDATLRPGLINLTVGENGVIEHCGIGYEVISPNGNVVGRSGWTWPVNDTHRAALEAAMDAIITEAAADEGLAGVTYPTFEHGTGQPPTTTFLPDGQAPPAGVAPIQGNTPTV